MDEKEWRSHATGVKYDLSKYIFIFTGNDGEKLFGGIPEKEKDFVWEKFRTRKEVNKVLLKSGVPDPFIGRLSGAILLRPFKRKHLEEISEKFLRPLKEELLERGIKVNFDKDFKRGLLDSIYVHELGARPLRSFVENLLTGEINKSIIFNRDKEIAQVHVKIREENPETQERKVLLSLEGKSSENKVVFSEEKDITDKVAEEKVKLSEKMVRKVSYHEAGHALVHQVINRDRLVNYISVLPEEKPLDGFPSPSLKKPESGKRVHCLSHSCGHCR